MIDSTCLVGSGSLKPDRSKGRFGLPDAKVAAGKAALLSRIILHDRRDLNLRDLRFDPSNTARLRNAAIPRPIEFLTKLRDTNDEAFHYWHTIHALFGT